ncbi:OmpA family protein [Herbaspirillum huttiense F1]|uniref:OmpA family protein n=1 Tax=Herbaspirillum huttiense subsp. lycopersici TaxID=3074428 RepID=A0ABU2ERK8_9BURK|nr:OmpA family protein [Herbaspirillum huttiense]MDR9850786.1 OmpA family protein [Herbaspirillum huttiense SE1]MDT0358947.1 OmpA family protein [Herbaspirillum huttiense F1]
MKKPQAIAMGLTIMLCVAACKKPEPPSETTASNTPSTSPASAAQQVHSEQNAIKVFMASNLPVSTVKLGAFPYIALPNGYVTATAPDVADFDQVPFWTGDRIEAVEGKVWSAHISTVQDKTFSNLELQRNIENVIASLDGKKIFDGKIPAEALQRIERWPRNFAEKYNSGLGDIWNNDAQVFVVHQADRDLWIHFCSYQFGAGLLIAETKPLVVTAGLLPANEMKKQIYQTGKVALHVNFATDKAEILPDSQPQIRQVVQLLKEDKALKLAINGYTDNTGEHDHNKRLSEDRAKAVATAIIGQGIDSARLSSAGFGEADPAADNTTEAGKSQNRRVELVKQ